MEYSDQKASSSILGVYSASLCKQCLLLAVEVMHVCPEDNKSVAVWMRQACLLQLCWHCCTGQAAAGNLCCHRGWKMAVWWWDQFTWRIRLNLGALASFRACFLLWVKWVIQKPGSITDDVVQVLLALFVILPKTTRSFKGNFTSYELLERTE